jgi:DNA-binding GntR family transcriptional regulator
VATENTRDWAQRPLERTTTAETVAEHLREEIISRRLGPGTRLLQNEVARQLGVSSTPVREAFALLHADGLIRLDPHRGALVFNPTIDDVRDLMEMREALEELGIRKAVPAMTPEFVTDLQHQLDELRAAAKERERDLHREFHRRVFEPAARPRLLNTIVSMRDATAAYMPVMGDAWRQRFAEQDQEHQLIVEACRRKDARELLRLLRAHRQWPVPKGAALTGGEAPRRSA